MIPTNNKNIHTGINAMNHPSILRMCYTFRRVQLGSPSLRAVLISGCAMANPSSNFPSQDTRPFTHTAWENVLLTVAP